MEQRSSEKFSIECKLSKEKRIDKYLANKIDSLSRSKIQKLINSGNILVDDREIKKSYNINKGEKIDVEIPAPKPTELIPEDIPLDIIYEDEHYIAINKQPHLVVHPGPGHRQGTLVNGLVNYTDELSSRNGTNRPGLVHRLDKDTTGVIIAAKNDEAHWKLSELFAERKIYKEYRALVWGAPSEDSDHLEKKIGRSKRNRKKMVVTPLGKYADTKYHIFRNYNLLSMLKLELGTGRTHQIRVHMKYLGHPVIADQKYGNDTRYIKGLKNRNCDLGRKIVSNVDRQLLHAYKIKFKHPITKQDITIKAPIPDDFRKVEQLISEWYYY